MRRRLVPLRVSLSLLAVFLAACAPAQTQSPPAGAASPTTIIASTATSGVDVTAPGVPDSGLNSATSPPPVQAVATSRGPNLEATDPRTVSMAAGGLQF